ncbi:hypothetical protein ACFVYE_27845 [Streptomyces sp. NPDC058239]|uniref:hypothetical protein n=1 Tax=unclassified Streptomyces TaxID=2593676 RepID=UPI003655C361
MTRPGRRTNCSASRTFDTVTHDPHLLRLLVRHASKEGIVCGSDYPFDMAESDPVRFATDHGPAAATLTSNARAYLGL